MLEDFRLVSKFRDESRGLRVALGAQFDPIEAGDLRDALSGKIYFTSRKSYYYWYRSTSIGAQMKKKLIVLIQHIKALSFIVQ